MQNQRKEIEVEGLEGIAGNLYWWKFLRFFGFIFFRILEDLDELVFDLIIFSIIDSY